MSTVLTVENLSKKYSIGHQKQGEYLTFRDALSNGAKSIYQHICHPLSANQGKIETEEFWALKDVNFKVKSGDRVGIIGRNGAGKSTLLKILSRITQPTTGKIIIRGRIASLLEVGTGFHPELTGRENVFLNGAILGMTKYDIKMRFDEIVSFAEVEKFLDTPVKRYSSGMYVRLAFAVAAHLEPEILIIDEVLSVGDVQFQKKCLTKMDDVGREGRTIIFVSHNMSIVTSLCNIGILLDSGMKIASGKASSIVEKYLEQMNKDGISKYENRKKDSQKVHLKRALILNQKKEPVQTVNSGDQVTFIFDIANFTKISRLSLNFSIYNNIGNKIINFNSLNRSSFDKTSETARFACEISELLLSEGTYRINMALLDGNEYLEHLESFLVFDVCAAPLKGRQILNANFGTNILMHHLWIKPG